MWHVTPDMWQVTCDMWHVTHDTWQVVNIVSKCQVPSFNGLGFMVFWRFEGKDELLNFNQWITKVFEEQPGYTGSVNKKFQPANIKRAFISSIILSGITHFSTQTGHPCGLLKSYFGHLLASKEVILRSCFKKNPGNTKIGHTTSVHPSKLYNPDFVLCFKLQAMWSQTIAEADYWQQVLASANIAVAP